MWNKFDSLDASTWPPTDEEVFWKIKVNQLVNEGLNIVSHLRINYEGRPVIFDPFLQGDDRHFGTDRYLDKDTETAYWMKIPSVESGERIVPPGEGPALLEVLKSLMPPKDSDDFFW